MVISILIFYSEIMLKLKSLITFHRTFGLTQHITSPTRLTGFSKTCIDLLITNISDSLITHSGVLNDVVSDHNPILYMLRRIEIA